MNKEQKYILKLLQDYANGRQSKFEDVNWDWVCAYAFMHQIETIVYYQCKNFIPKKHEPVLKKAYFAHNKSYFDRQEALKKIDDAFSELKIKYLIFKGPELAQYYPNKELRTMGDIDILVKMDDFNTASDALERVGFEGKEHRYAEKHFTFRKLDFELHFQLLYDETANSYQDLEFCKQVWSNVLQSDSYRLHMEANYAYVHLLLHTKKHFMNKGIGFRQLMDIYFMNKNAKLNPKKTQDYIEILKLKKFNEACLSLTSYWFDDNKNIDDKDFFNTATELVFKSGVFGFSNKQEENVDTLNRKMRYGKLGSIVGVAFPNYENMSTSDHYKFVKNRAYLLPIAWVYRFIRLPFKKDKVRYKNFIEETINDSEFSKQWKESLKSWGLIDED